MGIDARDHDRIASEIAAKSTLHRGDVIDVLRRHYCDFDTDPVKAVEGVASEISQQTKLSEQDVRQIINGDSTAPFAGVEVKDGDTRYMQRQDDDEGVNFSF